MTLVIKDVQIELLAQKIALDEGVSVTEVVRESLLSLAGIRGVAAQKAPLRERLTALAHEVDKLPKQSPNDNRNDNDILGYNEYGTW